MDIQKLRDGTERGALEDRVGEIESELQSYGRIPGQVDKIEGTLDAIMQTLSEQRDSTEKRFNELGQQIGNVSLAVQSKVSLQELHSKTQKQQ